MSNSYVGASTGARIGKVLTWLGLAALATVWLVPLAFMFITSLKSNGDISTNAPWNLPEVWMWSNFPDSWVRGNLAQVGWNSLLVAGIKVPLGLALSSMAAFALARLNLKRGTVILMIIAIGSMIPIQIALGPLFGIINQLDLLNTHLGLLLPYLAFGIPTQVFMFYNFFSSIPKELDEAARIDGTNNWQLFFRIILPISGPVFGALFILDFVATWNEYAMATTLLQDQAMYMIPQAIQHFNTAYQSEWGQLNAFVISTMIPVMIVYLAFQRFFTSGALSGAVKG